MKFELNDEMLAIIDQGLQELPFKVAAPMLNELNRQIAEQRAAQASAKAAEDTATAPGEAAPHQEMLGQR